MCMGQIYVLPQNFPLACPQREGERQRERPIPYLSFRMQWLEFTLVLLISGAGALLVYRSDRKKGSSRPWITASLRALLLFLVGLLLLSPSFPREVQFERQPVIIWLQDRSA